MKSWDELDPFEVLGVSPGASVTEIRQAWERLEAALAPGSLAVYSLLEGEEQARLLRQARVAYQRLLRAAGVMMLAMSGWMLWRGVAPGGPHATGAQEAPAAPMHHR